MAEPLSCSALRKLLDTDSVPRTANRWDRLFGTYRAQPAAGHADMTLGLANYRDPKWLQLHWMLAVPFARPIR